MKAFKLAAVRYATICDKSQQAAVLAMGISDKTLGGWINDATPQAAGSTGQGPAAGVMDVEKFDELCRSGSTPRTAMASRHAVFCCRVRSSPRSARNS